MITDQDNFVLDVTRDAGHRVPNGGNLLINYRHSVLENRSHIEETMVYHG